MALRINQSVIRGEIDNRNQGRVYGSLWVIGRDQPIAVDLSGNCWRDLAGCIVRFNNPQPVSTEDERTDLLQPRQEGVAGDITASRKLRVFDVPLEQAMAMAKRGEAPPEHMANCLYMEWF